MNIKIVYLNNRSPFFFTNIRMFCRNCAYVIGTVNLILVTVAIVCVVQAEDRPELFSLVYIAIGVFIFYMGTIMVIIVLQIIETYQQRKRLPRPRRSPSTPPPCCNQSSPEIQIQIPMEVTEIVSQLNNIIQENLTKSTEIPVQSRISRSQTLPVTLSTYTEHQTSPSSTLKI